MQLTGSQALIKALEMEGVDTIFGLPGGCILPVYDPLLDSPIRHILVRHDLPTREVVSFFQALRHT
jgi:acetolactate synthase-1/2/3 large subunit